MTDKTQKTEDLNTTEFRPTADTSNTVDFAKITEVANPLEAPTMDRQEVVGQHLLVDKSNLPNIAGYQLRSEIAKGGMGRVYLAYDPSLDRDVAIKTLLPGANAIRFITEAKITAKLPHPCIPPVHALGTLADGTPYLTMKYIRGRTLADELSVRPDPKMSLAHFVQIFEQIAQAVGFAHSRGIIHRDLKPSNVMVGEFGEVQVMDWGLAKEVLQTEDRIGEQAITAPMQYGQTIVGSVMGTPGFMAPEQARGEIVDARADVFSLGATLIAILTGQPAFAGSTVRESLDMAAKASLEDAHIRLNECGLDTELVALAKRCIAPDPVDRPQNGEMVAKEIAEYRNRLASRLRQAELEKAATAAEAREFSKRRKQWFIAAALVLLALSAGLLVSLWQMQRAMEAEQLAKVSEIQAKIERDEKEFLRSEEAKRAEGERVAKEQAQRNLDYARKANEILGSVFTALDPYAKYETIADLRTALKNNLLQASSASTESTVVDPIESSQLQTTLGISLLGLGETEEAIRVLEAALGTASSQLGNAHPKTLGIMGNLAESYRIAGNYAKAMELNEQTIAILKTSLGATHRDTLTAMNNLAASYHSSGMLDKAIPLYEETLSLRKSQLNQNDSDILASINNLAAAYYAQGRIEEALKNYEEALSISVQTKGAEHLDTLTMINNIAAVNFKSGNLERATYHFEESLRLRKIKLGSSHPDTLTTMRNLGIVYSKTKQGDKAAAVSIEFIEEQRKNFAQDDPRFANYLALVSADLIQCEQYETAEKMLRQCLEIRQSNEPIQWLKFNTMSVLGETLLRQKKYKEAEELLLNGYSGLVEQPETLPPEGKSRILEAVARLITLYTETNQQESLQKWTEIKSQTVIKSEDNSSPDSK